jgi:hypothetical protein
MSNIFEQLRRLTNETEATVIGAVAATIPWLAPIIPAYVAYENMLHVLAFPSRLAIIGAAVVEFLGLSAIHTAVQFWDYNRTRRKVDEAAPVYIAAAVGAFYLAVVLTVNVILDSAPAEQLIAKALLSLISIPAGVTLAIRAQHSRQLLQVDADKRDRRLSKLTQPQPAVNQTSTVDKVDRAPKTVGDLTPGQRRIYDAMRANPAANYTEIGQQLGISRQAVSKQVKGMNGVMKQL